MTTTETREEFIRKGIVDICESSGVKPEDTLRDHITNVITNVVNGYFAAENKDVKVTSLNEFFECDDFVELTWFEIYSKLFNKGLELDFDKVNSEESSNNKPKEKVIHFGNEMN